MFLGPRFFSQSFNRRAFLSSHLTASDPAGCRPRREMLVLYGDGVETYVTLRGRAEQLC